MDALSEPVSTPSGSPPVLRTKSPRKLRYESEAQVIRNRFGSLEDFRAQLGLSRRSICNLLLVDPSAWTRWTASGGKAPPHIYRALEWYWYLMQKNPGAAPVGSWGAQIYRERLSKIETELVEVKREQARSSHWSGLGRRGFFLGLGLGVLIGVGLQAWLG